MDQKSSLDRRDKTVEKAEQALPDTPIPIVGHLVRAICNICNRFTFFPTEDPGFLNQLTQHVTQI